MDVLTEFKIPYLGLKDGQHHFDFEIGETFFSTFDESIADACNLKMHVLLDKKPNMVVCDFEFEGTVVLPCDRCGGEFESELSGEDKIVYKFDDADTNDDESLIVLPPSAGELDLAPQVFEIVQVRIPIRSVHESEEDCDPEVIKKLNELKPKVNHNPQWEELLKLKKK